MAAREDFAPVVKSETADTGKYKYKYATLAALLEAVTPALTRHGLVLIQYPSVDTYAGVMVPTLHTVLLHPESSTEVHGVYPLLPARPNDPQALGGAETYARRYSAQTILGIAPEDDDGQNASRKAQPKRAESVDPAQEQEVLRAIAQLGECGTLAAMKALWTGFPPEIRGNSRVAKAKDVLKARLGGGQG